MMLSEAIFLFVAVGAISLFAAVLGLASWEEGKGRRIKR